MFASFALVCLATSANAYWLMGADFLTSQRMDPIISPGKVSGHVHAFAGASNVGFEATTESLRQSECTSIPIKEDKSAYWAPKLFFQHKDGSFSSLGGGMVLYYLFPDKAGSVTAFPDDFRMIAGNPTLRSFTESKEQRAVSFKCLDFKGTTTEYSGLPTGLSCPDGIRAQINFPSCWNGKDTDSSDHTSHMAYPSNGPDSGTCNDPNYPVTTVRIFMEIYWSGELEDQKGDAMDPAQPYVFSYGDPTGFGFHADFINGWLPGTLQKAADHCNCDIYGSPKCCADQGIFTYDETEKCRITNSVDENVFGKLDKLPGNNPVQKANGNQRVSMLADNTTPTILSPVYVYHGDTPAQVGSPVSNPSQVVHDGSNSGATEPSSSTADSPAATATNVNNSGSGGSSTGGSSGGSSGANGSHTCSSGSRRRSHSSAARSHRRHRSFHTDLEDGDMYRRLTYLRSENVELYNRAQR